MTATSAERQDWLERVVKALRPYFKERGYEVPDNVRISIGFPRGAHGRGRAIGQCWYAEGSDDEHNEVFISPELGQVKKADKAKLLERSVLVVGTIVHELCHTIGGPKAGHKRAFREIATAVGLEGKMTATTAGDDVADWTKEFCKKHGTFPAGRLNPKMRVVQSTRMIKCTCETCGMIARSTRKWIKESGVPHCGVKSHGRMISDYEPEEDEE